MVRLHEMRGAPVEGFINVRRPDRIICKFDVSTLSGVWDGNLDLRNSFRVRMITAV